MFFDTDFIYDGQESINMGVSIIRLEGGLIESSTLKQQIIEEKINSKDIPVFYGVSRDVLTFPIVITKLDEDGIFTYEDRVRILRWLCKGEYKEFASKDSPIVYYVLFDEVKKTSNVLSQGYITLNVRLNAPYGFSPIQIEEHDLYDNTTTEIIELENNSNIIDFYYPEIEFTVTEGTSVTFRNLTNGGEIFTINGLIPTEVIYINMETGRIKSNIGIYHLGDCNKNWLYLVYGINRIEITGKIQLSVRMQFPMIL